MGDGGKAKNGDIWLLCRRLADSQTRKGSCDGALLHDTEHCMHCKFVCHDSVGHKEPVLVMSGRYMGVLSSSFFEKWKTFFCCRSNHLKRKTGVFVIQVE